MALPRFVVLKSNYNDQYLRYIHEDVQVHGFLQFSGGGVVNPYTKLEVKPAESGRGLVHIRCCYNNKYWVRSSPNFWWIVAGADEPEEDQSKWSCTLFEPVFYVDDDAPEVFRLRHIQLNHYACLQKSDPPFNSCLFARQTPTTPDNNDLRDLFTIIDWASLLILPKHVAFKDDNGKYLSALTTAEHPYLQFRDINIEDETVGNQAFITRDGSVRIRSDFFGKFWTLRRSSDGANWIWAAESGAATSNNPDTLFRFLPTKVNNVVGVALRNLGNNNFCKSLTVGARNDCLNAAVPDISEAACLQVEEPLKSRKIFSVNFHLKDARIYEQSFRKTKIATAQYANPKPYPQTVHLKFHYKEPRRRRTWNSSVSVKSSFVETTLQSGVPLIAGGTIEILEEINETYRWGTTVHEPIENRVVQLTITAQPMSSVVVDLLATLGSCDVPFSYYQRDTLINGQQITYYMEDGIYTGFNYYNFKLKRIPIEP